MTGRRGFLTLLGLAAAGAVLDPELALWVPGRRTYFVLPPPTNTVLTIDQITREALLILSNKLGRYPDWFQVDAWR